jgi:hypothetical protein
MEYTVISNKKVCGKVKDDKLTRDDILSAGGSVEHLLAAGHIKAANAGSVTKVREVKEVKEAPKQDFSFEEKPAFQIDNSKGEESWQL